MASGCSLPPSMWIWRRTKRRRISGSCGSPVWIANFDSSSGTVSSVYRWTSIATDADGELWSPDGKNILFVSNVYPQCDGPPETEVACNAKKLDEANKSKVKALIFDRLL